MIAEHAGLGLLAGCCCVLLLLPILLWRQEAGQTVALVFPSLGVVLGAVVGFRKRPALRAVAEFADARFDTADLLATALTLRDSGEPWHINILKTADASAARFSPSLLTPHRLGGRAWSGILLALIAALTLGLLSITTPMDRAQASAPPAPTDTWREWEDSGAQHRETIRMSTQAALEARAESTPDSQSNQGNDAASSDAGSAQKSNHSPREGQAETGVGGGSARTDSAHVELPSDHHGISSDDPVANAPIASAGQGAEVRDRANGGVTAGQVSTQERASVAPWSSSDWPAAQTAAMNAVQNGRVPDAYRNLVRDYFQNQSEPIDGSHGQ